MDDEEDEKDEEDFSELSDISWVFVGEDIEPAAHFIDENEVEGKDEEASAPDHPLLVIGFEFDENRKSLMEEWNSVISWFREAPLKLVQRNGDSDRSKH